MKKIFYVLFAFILISSLVLSVSAHPGRTDSDGGHTDSSTGEYHYHHGYQAHDHYDMDGDGDIDCPYDFEDRTDRSSGNNSRNNTSTNSTNNNSESPSTNTTATTPTPIYPIHQVESKSNYTYSYIAFGFVLVVLVFTIWLANHEFNDNTQYDDKADSLGGKILSSLSVIIIFGILFAILFFSKYPITLQEISFWEMIWIIVKSCFLGGFVWALSMFTSLPIVIFFSKIFRLEMPNLPSMFWWFPMPLSYIFSVSAFIFQ